MRKVPSKYENPIDDILIRFADFLCPTFNQLNFTANGITTLSLLFGLFSIIFFYRGKILPFVLFYIISYFFDCMDGHYARKYDQVSKFGDFYDHIKDIIVAIALIIVLYIRNKDRCGPKILVPVIIIFIMLTIAGYAHLGCQEKYRNKNESATLNFGKKFCPGNPEKNMKVTRWFGMGTWVIITLICVIVLEKSNICKS